MCACLSSFLSLSISLPFPSYSACEAMVYLTNFSSSFMCAMYISCSLSIEYVKRGMASKTTFFSFIFYFYFKVTQHGEARHLHKNFSSFFCFCFEPF